LVLIQKVESWVAMRNSPCGGGEDDAFEVRSRVPHAATTTRAKPNLTGGEEKAMNGRNIEYPRPSLESGVQE